VCASLPDFRNGPGADVRWAAELVLKGVTFDTDVQSQGADVMVREVSSAARKRKKARDEKLRDFRLRGLCNSGR
jgi:hypothetical protein